MLSLAESQTTVCLLTQRLHSRSNTRWRLGLRILSTFLILIGLGLHIGAVVQPASSHSVPGASSSYSYEERPWVSPEGFTFLTAALLWNIAEFITLKVRGRQKGGIHPGAHVAIDLQLWMGFFGSGAVQLLLNYWNGMAAAAGTFKVILAIVHFILFVFACIDTDRRRKLDKARFMVEVTSAAAATAAASNQQHYAHGNEALPGFPPIPPGMALVPIEMLRLERNGGRVYVSNVEVEREGAIENLGGERGYQMEYLKPMKG